MVWIILVDILVYFLSIFSYILRYLTIGIRALFLGQIREECFGSFCRFFKGKKGGGAL
jgi:hypothetical protein